MAITSNVKGGINLHKQTDVNKYQLLQKLVVNEINCIASLQGYLTAK